MTNKEIFIETYNKNIHRPGAEKLLAWLEGTDFFTAPASTRFHAAYEGGLLDHSLNVYNVLISKHFNPETDDLESYTIVSLLHDLCKAGFYKTELRNRKNDRGEWEKVPVYAVDDQFPYGHGEPRKRSPCAGTWAALTSRSRAAASHSRTRSRSTRLP